MDAGFDPALRDLPLREFRPRSSASGWKRTTSARSRFPAIDVHNHLGRWLSEDGRWTSGGDVDDLIALMDSCNVTSIVNLDGRWGDELEANLDRYDRGHPGRFATFCHLDWSVTSEPDFTDRLVGSLKRSAAAGAKGVKVWKDLGLRIRDHADALLMPDDDRLSDVWDIGRRARAPDPHPRRRSGSVLRTGRRGTTSVSRSSWNIPIGRSPILGSRGSNGSWDRSRRSSPPIR